MPTTKKRRVYEEGHRRKFLVVVGEEPEVESAMLFAAWRVRRTHGSLSLVYVIEPGEFQHWMGVRDIQVEEETSKAQAIFRLFRRKLKNAGFEDIPVEEVIREGNKAEQIVELIEEDEDVAILVLGAATEQTGPGPLVASLAAGRRAGTFPIPITIVPGNLSSEDIEALA